MKQFLITLSRNVLFPGVLSLALAFIFLGISPGELSNPFLYNGDEIFYTGLIKSVVENGWYLLNPNIGLPYGQELYEFPQGTDNFHIFIIWLFSLFTDKPFLILNSLFLFSFALSHIVALNVLKKLNISYWVSFSLGLLFAFLPYHFLRGTNHIFIACYYFVPLSLLLTDFISRPELQRLNLKSLTLLAKTNKWSLFLIVGICFLIASSGLYYAFFTGLMVITWGILWAVKNSSFPSFIAASGICTLIVAGIVLNNLPTFIYTLENQKNEEAVRRSPHESEYYGLKIAQLILPVSGHRIDRLNEFKGKYESISILVNENRTATLGLVGSLGFVILLIWILLRTISSTPSAINSSKHLKLLDKVAVLNITLFLFATIGGLSSLFSYLITSNLRSVNRASIMIAWLSLVAIAVVLEKIREKYSFRPAFYLLVAIVLVVGLLDQTSEHFKVNLQGANKYKHDIAYFASIEAISGKKAKIFQLPYFPFPEQGGMVSMADYDHYKPYLSTKTVKWTYGAMRGRASDLWQRQISSLPADELIQTLSGKGFTGILIDRFGYEDAGSALEHELQSIFGRTGIVSSNGRYCYFTLENILSDSCLSEINFQPLGNSFAFTGTGWGDQDVFFRWTTGEEAKITLPGTLCGQTVKAHVAPLTKPGVLEAQKAVISVNDQILGEWIIKRDTVCSIDIPENMLSKTSINQLVFHLPMASTPQSLGINNDIRKLGLQFMSISFER